MLQNINIRDNHVEVGLVLPWKKHIYIDYTVSCQWPPSPTDHPGSSPVSVSGVSGPGLGPWVYAGAGIIHYSISIEGELFVSLLYIFICNTNTSKHLLFLKVCAFQTLFYCFSVSVILLLSFICFWFCIT